MSLDCCILLKFYIKPQHPCCRFRLFRVVSYWNSTSNHNHVKALLSGTSVVSYWNSTSNHNNSLPLGNVFVLYLIEILHQTTTQAPPLLIPLCCILLKFYIKPQLARQWLMVPCVVSYWNSTSNHNILILRSVSIIVVSYWNSTSNHNVSPPIIWITKVVSYWNSTSNHNMNARRQWKYQLYLIEILHQTTTTSHSLSEDSELYLIEILHQTTTFGPPRSI